MIRFLSKFPYKRNQIPRQSLEGGARCDIRLQLSFSCLIQLDSNKTILIKLTLDNRMTHHTAID